MFIGDHAILEGFLEATDPVSSHSQHRADLDLGNTKFDKRKDDAISFRVLPGIQRFPCLEQLSDLLGHELTFYAAARVSRAIALLTLVPIHNGLG